MHSHHAVDLQVIYSADPSVELSVTPGMYPHGHVGEGKPDDNSRSVVGITNGLAMVCPTIPPSLTTPEPTSLGDAALRVSALMPSGAPSSKSGTWRGEPFPLRDAGTLLTRWPDGTSLLSSQSCLASQALRF